MKINNHIKVIFFALSAIFACPVFSQNTLPFKKGNALVCPGIGYINAQYLRVPPGFVKNEDFKAHNLSFYIPPGNILPNANFITKDDTESWNDNENSPSKAYIFKFDPIKLPDIKTQLDIITSLYDQNDEKLKASSFAFSKALKVTAPDVHSLYSYSLSSSISNYDSLHVSGGGGGGVLRG